jgi:hypothetical protein
MREALLQGQGYALEKLWPITASTLTPEAERGIPATGLTGEPPTPVGHVVEQQPGGVANRAGQMGHGAVIGDQQIAIANNGSGSNRSTSSKRPSMAQIAARLP